MEFAHHPRPALPLLVEVDVARRRSLEDAEVGFRQRHAQLRQDVIPKVFVQGIITVKMSKIPADHRSNRGGEVQAVPFRPFRGCLTEAAMPGRSDFATE